MRGATRTQAKPTAQQVEVEVGGRPLRSNQVRESEKQWTKGMVVPSGPRLQVAILWARKTMLNRQDLL